MRTKKRFLSILLTLVMLVGLVPAAALADEAAEPVGELVVEPVEEIIEEPVEGEQPAEGEQPVEDEQPVEVEEPAGELVVVEAEEAALGLMLGMSLTANADNSKAIAAGEAYYLGDSIAFGENSESVYVLFDDDPYYPYIGHLFRRENTRVTAPTYNARFEQWTFSGVWKCSYGISGEATGDYLSITGSGDVAPIGFKCSGGSGTSSDPFTFEAIYPPHTHSFTYTADGATITATCTASGCTLTENPTLTIVKPILAAYGGEGSAEATITGSIEGVTNPTIVYKKGDTTLTAAPTDAGTYTANITLGDATASVEYTIAKADIAPTVSLEGWTYGATANAPSVTGNTGSGTVTYTYNDAEDGTYSGTVPTDAGTYYVKAAVAETANYNAATSAPVSFTIAKAAITPVVSLEDWTYGKTAGTPSVDGNSGDGAVTYTYSDAEDGTYSETVPTDAGTYYVKAAVAETDNYNAATAAPVSFTIAKAAITITPDDKSSKYGEDIAELTYQVGGDYVSGDDLGVTLNTTATKSSDVGEYEIEAGWNSNANYTATLNTGKYTVTKTSLTMTATGYSGAYDGTAHGITVDVGDADATVYYAETELTDDNYSAAGSTTLVTRTDAGTTTVYYYVEGKNYDSVSGNKDIEITKADNAAATPAEVSMWDAESANVAAEDGQEYVIVPKGGTPDWTEAVEGDADGNVAFANLTPATEYEIYTRVKEDGNHKPGEAVKTDLLTNLFGLEMMDELYVGETITVKPDPADAQGLSYQWYYAEEDDGVITCGEIIEGANSASYTIKPEDHGKTLWVEITRNGKALDNATYGPVEKREIEPAVTIEGWAANESANAPSVTGNTGNGAVTYTYAVKGSTDFSAAVPTAAGDYTVKAVIAETDRYYGGEATADFTIKAVYTVKFSTDGGTEIKDQTVVTGEKAAKPDDPTKAGNSFDGWFQDATFAVAFDFATPITTDVTIYAKFTPNDYQLISVTGATADISHTWTKGSSDDVVITVKLATEPDDSFAHFVGVEIDGKALVRDTDYTAKEGSTIVTLKAATVQKLSVGEHTVSILFDNGKVDTKLTVKAAPGTGTNTAKSGSPKTGDESSAGLWLAVLAMCGFGLGGMIVNDRKRRTTSKH